MSDLDPSVAPGPDLQTVRRGQRGSTLAVVVLPLGGWRNGVRVDSGQCLLVEGGPFWDAVTVIDRATEATGVWHPLDDWGARVQLHNGPCPEPS